MSFLTTSGLSYFWSKLKGLFATKAELEAVRQSVSKAYHFKGSVADVASLPANAEEGDVYNVGSSLDGDNYAWTGTAWDKLGGTIDLSSYALDANVVHKTGDETVAGIKTFTSEIDERRNTSAVVFRNVFTNLTKNTAPSSQFNSLIDLVADKDKVRINSIEAILRTNGDSLTRLYAFNNAGLSSSANLETYNYADGTGVAHAPSTPASDNVHAGNTDIITRDFLTANYPTNSDALIKAIDAYYAVRRTGKVYQTKFPLYGTATTTAGEKLLDNAGLVCVPSTDTVEGQDDYADIPMFQWVNVNYIREADGSPVPTAIEGMSNYATSGSVDVGVMQMSFWWKWEEKDGYIYVTVSDLPHEELGLIPWRECVKADGTVLPYCIGSKYMAGDASDGNKRSQPGINIWNRTCSNQTCITEFQKKGAGYWGAGMEAGTFQIIMFAIKYANKNMQSIMMGCTDYNVYGYVALAETDATRILLPANTSAFAEGSYIQAGSSTVANRDSADCYDVCDHAKILSIEQVEVDGTTYTALNIDKTVTTVLGGVVMTTPYNAGATDAVLGRHDGSPVSNSDGDHPYRIQGREYAVGAWTVACDLALSTLSNKDQTIYFADKGVAHSVTAATIQSTYENIGTAFGNNGTNYWLGDLEMNADAGVWYPKTAGRSNSTGWADYRYNSSSTGWREAFWGGSLHLGLNAGPCYWHGGLSLGDAYWSVAARD